MRIIVNGQQAFGKASLEAILDAGKDEVVAVYTAPDKEGKPIDPIKELAIERGVPVIQPANYKDAEVLDELRALNADLMVMAFMIIFVPEEARNIPTHGSICFHPSLLPLHRGPSSINWPIMWGAKKTGLTIFWPDDGLDEGEILLQKEVDIAPDDTLGDVYFKKIFPLGVEAVLESIELVRAGNPPRIKQDDSKATYESWCKKAHAEIDWNRSVGEVYNQIRATNPAPGAWTLLEGKTLQIFDSAKVEAAGRPGEIVSITDDGFTVVAGLGGILIKRVRYDGGAKVAAKEFVDAHGLKIGARLGE
ncbi:MAG: formyltransferase family protein [Alphaproteobacteria bacterium]|nr:formyltransferase family protein [Alphaproteobacteria bacterium]